MERNNRRMLSRTFLQILASITATLGIINDGMHFGWSAPVIPILRLENSPIKISKSDESRLETIYMIGGIAALPVTIYIVDRIGRKRTIILASCTSLIAWILIAFASSVSYLYVARFLVGFSSDLSTVTTPMYIAEISHKKIRGLLSSLFAIMFLIGTLLIYAIAPYTPFYVPSIVGGSFLLIQIAIFPRMPKSPYHMVSKNKPDSALKALNNLRPSKNNEEELGEIINTIQLQRQEKGRPRDLFLISSGRKAFIIILLLNGAKQFCGFSVMIMNMHSILGAGSSTQSNLGSTVFIVFMLIATTIFTFSVDRCGRKRLVIASSIFSGTCLLTLAIYFNLKLVGYNVSSVSWIPAVVVWTYAAAFKLGIGTVPIVMCAEIFPNKAKALGMTISDTALLIFGLISIELYEWLSESYGYHVPFYLFAFLTFMAAVFMALIVPETKGRTLGEIQCILKGEKPDVRDNDLVDM